MKSTYDLTEGKPLKVIMLFAIPLFLGNIFQQFYNLVDIAIVGHVLGDEAFAAVGATSSILNLFFGLAYGVPNGFSVVIARFFGAKEYAKMKKAVAMSVLIGIMICVFLSAIGLMVMDSLLVFLSTPDEIMVNAKIYIYIVIGFLVVTMTYNVLAAVLRAIGNTTMPLVFLIISCVLNIGLDFLFVAGFGFGVAGAAYATVISQAISAVLCFIYLIKKCPLLAVSKEDFQLDWEIIRELLASGLSMGLMLSIVSIGSVALQSAINQFGTTTISAHTAARKFVETMMMPLATLSMSSSTFASQNLGAGKIDRIKKGITTTLMIAAIWSVFVNVIGYLFAAPIVKLISGTSSLEVITTAKLYIRINVPFYFVLIFLLILRMTLQGLKRKIVPLIASFVELSGKFMVVWLLVPPLGYLGICFAEPITWSICAIMVVADFLFLLKKLKNTEEIVLLS